MCVALQYVSAGPDARRPGARAQTSEIASVTGCCSRAAYREDPGIGCGSGTWIREFLRWGAQPENITGIDVLSERIREARRLSPAGITWLCRSATDLADMRGKFDLVLQSTVFTSILDGAMKRQIAKEMLLALAPRGIILWYDFRMNNPRNPDVCGIEKSEIRQLFIGCSVALERLTLAPPLGRPLALWSPSLYRIAATIKSLCTHYLGYIKKD